MYAFSCVYMIFDSKRKSSVVVTTFSKLEIVRENGCLRKDITHQSSNVDIPSLTSLPKLRL